MIRATYILIGLAIYANITLLVGTVERIDKEAERQASLHFCKHEAITDLELLACASEFPYLYPQEY